MDKYAKAFVKSSLIYLGIGAILGLLMVLGPNLRFNLTRVHTHINLLGFMAMMVYGVGYHILPRFMGRPLYSPRLANVQVWLANITLDLETKDTILGMKGRQAYFKYKGSLTT